MIRPDTKDWTWVVERPCPECGFEAGAMDPEGAGDLVRANAGEWARLHAGGRIRSGRTDPAAWSTLEYACHVRDVFRIYDRRIHLMLDEDDPLFPNWDQDASAVDDRYDEQDPAAVVSDLVASAGVLAATLDGIAGDQWGRKGRRSDGAAFTLATMVPYLVHDPVHHVWDVERLAGSADTS